MKNRLLIPGVALAAALLASPCLAGDPIVIDTLKPPAEHLRPQGQGDERLVAILRDVVEKEGVPGAGGMIVTKDGPVAMAVAGVRKHGHAPAVTLDDKWHLGSNTKAMTATLAGMLVEEGRLSWDTTLGEVFADVENIHPAWRDVTLLQLLTHHSGCAENLPWAALPKMDSPRAARANAVRAMMKLPPPNRPGGEALYSNTGFVVAGAMVEEVTGQAWEDLMRERLFKPLGMTSAGFGGVGTPGQLDQPWPHLENDKPAPRNGPDMDNRAMMGPAGTVHASLSDYGKFVAEHLRAGDGDGALLSRVTYARLHTPPVGDGYACGWLAAERGWADGVALNHAGCNTMNYVVTWIAPEKGMAFVVTMNVGDDAAAETADGAVWAMIEEFLLKE